MNADEQAVEKLQEQSEADFWKLVIRQDPRMEEPLDLCVVCGELAKYGNLCSRCVSEAF